MVVTVALAALPALSLGQDAQSDQAQALLKQGITQYDALKYADAKATLLKVDRTKLTAAQRKELDARLGRVDDAIKQQAADQEAYDQAVKALEANDLAKAAKLFDQAKNSTHLPLPVRRNARAQAALVAQKVKAAGAPGRPDMPKAAPSAKATRPATDAEPKAAVDQRLEELRNRYETAQACTAKGDQLLAEGKIDEAVAEYNKATEAFPEYEKAREHLAKAEQMRNQQADPGTKAITEYRTMLEIRRQEFRVRYGDAIKRSREALQSVKSTEDFDKAKDLANHAETLLVTSKELLTDEEYRARKAETDQLLDHIAAERKRWQEQKVAEQAREIERNVLKHNLRVQRERQDKIESLKRSARALRDEHKYAEAVEVLAQIHELDPRDNWASEQHRVLSQFVTLLNDKAAYRSGLREEEKQMVGIREAAVPWYDLLRFPRDWEDIKARRKGYSDGGDGESEANRAVNRALKQVLPKLNFSGIALGDVIQFVRDVSNTSIHVKWDMLRQVSIDQKTPVNVELTQVTVEKALKTILEDVGAINPLGYVVDEGVITISTKDDLATLTATRVYDIRDLIFQVPNFSAPDIDLTSGGGNGGNNGSSGGGLFGNSSGDDDDSSSYDDDDENRQSRQELVDNILDMIRSTIAPDTWQGGPAAGTTGSIRELNGQIIVTQTPENHRKVQDLLAQLREARAMLINVEARFITVNTGFLNRIGVDLDFYFNLGSRLNTSAVPMVDPVTGATVPGNTDSTWTTAGHQVSGSNRWSPMGVGQDSYTWANEPLETGVANSIGGLTNTALSFAGTFLDDVQVDFLVSATQAHQATRTLTAPRLTISNGQRAYVVIAEEQAYVAQLNAVVSDNVVGYTPIPGVVITGSVLEVEGVISADRRYVNLTLEPQVSTVMGFTEYQGTAGVAGSGTIQLPQLNVQRVACTVAVPDGGTLLLGGQRLAGEKEREMGVPIISRIPVLNRAFENRQIVRDQETLLILVKPKIIIQSEYEDAAFPPR